ncbi:MAG: phosphoribosylglycinamide synthetase C domain-containing protein [bacterium]
MSKKKFLFVSHDARSGDLAWKILQEGHHVKYFIKDPLEKEVYDGFIPKTDDWKNEIDWADVIIFDDVKSGSEAAELRKKGKLVVGGSIYTDKLENDRAFGQQELKSMKIPIIPQQDFTSFDDAIEFVKKNKDKYVLKPSGKAQENKSLLYISDEEDGQDLIQVLNDYKKAWSKKITSFQLQKRISGVEIAVGAFFDGHNFITPININFEHKKLFPGELGPSTGEMGTTMFWSNTNKIFNKTLKKFESRLAQEKYVGYIDINCIVNSHGIYPLEWTARFGYPTMSIQQEGILSELGDFFYKLANGENPKLKVKTGFQIGVVIVVPPFPFNDKKTFEVQSKDSIVRLNGGTNGVHIADVKLVNGEWLVSGTQGIVLTVCATGPTMKQAQSLAYKRISNINIPRMYYRDDIGNRWFEDSDKLHSWGYLREI